MMSHPLGNVFEAMMEKRQDQIRSTFTLADPNPYPNPNLYLNPNPNLNPNLNPNINLNHKPIPNLNPNPSPKPNLRPNPNPKNKKTKQTKNRLQKQNCRYNYF